MAAIGDFVDLVDQRTLADVEDVRRRQPPRSSPCRSRSSRRSCSSAPARSSSPAGWLLAPARRPDRRHPPHRRRRLRASAPTVDGVSELERVAGAFNEMAAAVESDVGRPRARRAGRRRGPPGRRGGQPGQVVVPRRDVARDPHPDDRRDRHARGARPDRPHAASSGRWSARPRARRPRCSRSSATRSTSRRSRPASSRSRRRPSPSATWSTTAVATFVHTASAKGLRLRRELRRRASPPPTSATRSASARSSATSSRTP